MPGKYFWAVFEFDRCRLDAASGPFYIFGIVSPRVEVFFIYFVPNDLLPSLSMGL